MTMMKKRDTIHGGKNFPYRMMSSNRGGFLHHIFSIIIFVFNLK